MDLDINVLPEYASGPTCNNVSILCYQATFITSTGIWLGDNPLNFALPLLLTQISLIFTTGRLAHALLRHLGQPKVISHLIAGIVLGPSVLARNEKYHKRMFPPSSWIHLNVVSLLALLLFVFMVGVKTDIGVIRRSGKKAFAISQIGTVIPYGLAIFAGFLLRDALPPNFHSGHLVARIAARWSTTSNIVLSCLLHEFHLLSSKLGRLAMGASLMADCQALVVTSIIRALSFGGKAHSARVGLGAIASFAVFFAVVVFMVRPFMLHLIRHTPEGGTMSEAYFLTILLVALATGLLGALLGHEAVIGPLLLGLLLPGGPPLGTTLDERLGRIVTGVLLPLYIATAGLRTEVASMKDSRQWGIAGIIIFLCAAGKFFGVLITCLCFGMSCRDAFAMAFLMLCKGIMEIFGAVDLEDTQMYNNQIYAVNILATVLIGGGTAALLKFLYKPSMRFVAHRRRTLQKTGMTDELRILACVHREENVLPVLNLLEASGATPQAPLGVFVIHLIPLIGRASAIFAPYRKKKKASAKASESDRIVNAFRFLEQQHAAGLFIAAYVCISPYDTMYNDVCALAADKKVALVIVPFHKQLIIDGTIEMLNPSIQALNVDVLTYAPCSVGILIDHGLSPGPVSGLGTGLLHTIMVYFLGGADDREALSLAARLAENTSIGLTVIRFLLPEELISDGRDEEAQLDDRTVNEFRESSMEDQEIRVRYQEEVVRDGAGTADVIRTTSPGYSLLIVGRGEGRESQLTAGLEMWSEFPELGIVGDILATTNFGCKVSTLVVQQAAKRAEREVDWD